MGQLQGTPIWYELASNPATRAAAEKFYAQLLGWEVVDSGMEGFDYNLAKSGEEMVAGMMAMPEDVQNMPPFWMTYFTVDDADATVAAAQKVGGSVHRPPADIPNTGRFAILADPGGAAFGILQPLPMEGEENLEDCGHDAAPHCGWIELMSPDLDAAFGFYSGLMGWQKSEAFDMGDAGIYQVFSHDGKEIGGMTGIGRAGRPMWLPYFTVPGVTSAIDRIRDLGGSVAHGPVEVPGGAFIAVAQDPQGAWFAVVGPEQAEA